MNSRSFDASFGEKTSAKSEYSVEIEVRASFTTNAIMCVLQKGWILPSWSLLELLRKAMYTTNILCPGSRTVIVNSFFPISLTCLIVERAFQ